MAELTNSSRTLCNLSISFLLFPTNIEAVTVTAALAMVNIPVSLFGTLANSLIIMAYYRNPRLRTIQNKIFLQLAVTDFGVSTLAQPMFLVSTFSGFLGSHHCILWALHCILSTFFLDVSLLTMTILSLQSYITLAFPYHWQNLITKSRLSVLFICVWFLVLLKTLSIFHFYYVVLYGSLSIIFLAVFTVTLTWIWTYKLVARHRKAIQTTQIPSSGQRETQKKVLRSTVTAFAVISGLLACFALDIAFFIFTRFLNPFTLGKSTFGILWSVASMLRYLNSLVNPCLVFWRSTAYREAVKNIF